MFPGRELNQRPLGLQAGPQSTEPHQPGLFIIFMSSSVKYIFISLFSCYGFFKGGETKSGLNLLQILKHFVVY